MPGSESEKRQGNVLGFCFSDKAEHMPIKKRRFLFRSPSPPPKTASPDNEVSTNPSRSQDDPVQSAVKCPATPKAELGKMSVDRMGFQCNHLWKVNEKLESNEDFSGISILAAAACSSSLGREFGYAEDGSGVEEPSVHEGPVEVSTNSEAQSSSQGFVRDDIVNTSDISIGGTSSCVTTALVGELAATSTAEYASEKAKGVEKSIKELSCGDGATTISLEISSTKDGDVAGSQKLHSRDDRLHWDLNVVMDSLEQPFDHKDAHTSDHIGSGAAIKFGADRKSAEAYDLLSKPENSPCDDKKKLPLREARKLVNQISQGNPEVNDDCDNENHPVSVCPKSISSECKKVPSSLVDDNNSAHPSRSSYVHENPPFLKPLDVHAGFEPVVVSKDSNVAAPLYSDLENVSGLYFPVTKSTVESVGAAVAKATNASAVDSQVRLTLVPTPDIENRDTPKLELTVKPFDDEWQRLKDDGNVEKEIDDPQRSNSMHDLAVTSDSRAGKNDFSMNTSDQAMTDVQVSMKEVTVPSAEHLEQKFISDASFDHCSIHGIETEGELQEDYDSQYEDGELREPTGDVWKEYDAVDGETEYSRYGASAVDHHVSESGHVRKTSHRDTGNAESISSVSRVGNEPCAKSDRAIIDDDDLLKSTHSGDDKIKGLASDELLESNKISSATVVRVRDDCDGKGRFYHHGTRSTDSEGIDTRADSVSYRRGLLSRIGGPVSRDMCFREDPAGNRWERGSRYAKSSERFRYMRSQPRNRQANSWDGSPDGRRGIKCNYSPAFRSLVKPDDDTVKEGKNGTLNVVSFSSRLSTNDVSIADGYATENFHLDPKLGGNPGSDRLMNRGRFLRNGPQMDRRASRGRYNGLSPDDSFQSSLQHRLPSSRRDRSLSPDERRGYPLAHQSHGRSPFRSRTRSPNPRLSPRGRSGAGNSGDVNLRRKSRSPNFRSEARMLRMRSPPHGPEFGSDMREFRSFERDHRSPPSRWINVRKDEMEHFSYKQRRIPDRSPGRVRLSCDRENFLDCARNSKPGVHYRVHTGRSYEMDVTGRRFRLEGNYENRRRRFCAVSHARRGYDYEDGIVKRLHHDDDGDDDAFVSTNTDVREFPGRGMRGVDNRKEDLPMRFRGDSTFMYERDEKFSANSKRFGFDGMDSSRNLKSGESFRSINPGRFNEMDGAGRGHRYVNSYDDRRYYSSVQLPRRSEMGSIGRRLSHEVDDSLPVAQSSCNNDATDYRGGNARDIDGRVAVLPRRQREEQQLDFSGQEKKLCIGTSMSTDLQVPAESESAKGNIPS